MKMIGTALGAVLLIFAIAINSTTSNINVEIKSSGTVSSKSESGIWLTKVSKLHGPTGQRSEMGLAPAMSGSGLRELDYLIYKIDHVE